MKFLWPSFLNLLLILPLLIAGYVWIVSRRVRFPLSYSNTQLIREALPGKTSLLRHIPFVLLVTALTSLIFALSRPIKRILVLESKPTVILALDVSLSMCAVDIYPNRLSVAQEAAKTFILDQNTNVKIGLVAFAGFSELIVPPTEDTKTLINAVDTLAAAPRTAIGSAILQSINAIAMNNDQVSSTDLILNQDVVGDSLAPANELQPDIIILLTDGASNRGADPVDAARVAMDRGVRVYTIGFGTSGGTTFYCTEDQLGEEAYQLIFGDQGHFVEGFIITGPGSNSEMALDEDTLRQVAKLTQGEYYLAESADALAEVFVDVPSYLETNEITTEISAFFTGFGALTLLLAFVLAQRWNPLP